MVPLYDTIKYLDNNSQWSLANSEKQVIYGTLPLRADLIMASIMNVDLAFNHGVFLVVEAVHFAIQYGSGHNLAVYLQALNL